MRTITLSVPDDLDDQLASMRDRLPELLALSLLQPAMLAHVYREILSFLAGTPTASEIASFGPTTEMERRFRSASPTCTWHSAQRLEEAPLPLWGRPLVTTFEVATV